MRIHRILPLALIVLLGVAGATVLSNLEEAAIKHNGLPELLRMITARPPGTPISPGVQLKFDEARADFELALAADIARDSSKLPEGARLVAAIDQANEGRNGAALESLIAAGVEAADNPTELVSLENLAKDFIKNTGLQDEAVAMAIEHVRGDADIKSANKDTFLTGIENKLKISVGPTIKAPVITLDAISSESSEDEEAIKAITVGGLTSTVKTEPKKTKAKTKGKDKTETKEEDKAKTKWKSKAKTKGKSKAKTTKTLEANITIFNVEQLYEKEIRKLLLSDKPSTEERARLCSTLSAAYGSAIENFLQGRYDLTDLEVFNKMPPQLLLAMSIYNELGRPGSGTTYFCAAALNNQSLRDVCKLKFVNLFLEHGLEASDLLAEAALPTKIIARILRVFRNTIRRRAMREWSAYRDAYEEWLALHAVGDSDSDDEGVAASTSVTKSSQPEIGPILETMSTMVTASAGAKVVDHNAVRSKLEALIKAGTPIPIDSLLPAELTEICHVRDTCDLLVTNVQPETVLAKRQILRSSTCSARVTRDSVEALPNGALRKAWNEVCAFGDTSFRFWLIMIILGSLVLISVIGAAVYFLYVTK